MPRVMLLGPPGSGKGTQAAMIVKRYEIPQISSGDALRSNLEAKTPLGLEAKRYMEAGELVPDGVIIALVEDLLEKADTKNGFLLDGFPRTMAQAEALDEIIEKKGIGLEKAIYLNVPRDVLVKRISLRRVCPACGASFHLVAVPPKKEGICDKCGVNLIRREDDNPETVEKRIEVYDAQTKPLIGYYERMGILSELKVDEDMKPEFIQAQIEAIIDSV